MTSLELIEYTIVTNGFAHDKVVAMGYSYSDLKKYCEETYGVSPIENGDTIAKGVEKAYSIKISNIPIVKY